MGQLPISKPFTVHHQLELLDQETVELWSSNWLTQLPRGVFEIRSAIVDLRDVPHAKTEMCPDIGGRPRHMKCILDAPQLGVGIILERRVKFSWMLAKCPNMELD